MAVNRVVYDGVTLVDLTSDTVTPDTLMAGVTAHDAAGNEITGEFDPSVFVQKTDVEAFSITAAELTEVFNSVFE